MCTVYDGMHHACMYVCLRDGLHYIKIDVTTYTLHDKDVPVFLLNQLSTRYKMCLCLL